MRRRELVVLLGTGAFALPQRLVAQPARMPVIGFLAPYSNSRGEAHHLIGELHRGLLEMGFAEGKNVAFEYRFADGHFERLPELAADLVRRAAVICTTSNIAALAVKEATSNVPHVFVAGLDPVQMGLVAAIDRPGGNRTGVYFPVSALEPKRLELLRELLPQVRLVAALVNPNNPNAHARNLEEAARALGLVLLVFEVQSPADIDAAFASLVQQRATALLVTSDPLFDNERHRVVGGASRNAVPAMYPWRDFADAGGLLSYGNSLSDAGRRVGLYSGRILKGEKPGDLPVWLPTKFEFVINMKTAKALGITVPLTLQAQADEVIE